MTDVLDPAVAGVIAYVTGLFTLAMVIEALRALIWIAMTLWVFKRCGLYVGRAKKGKPRGF